MAQKDQKLGITVIDFRGGKRTEEKYVFDDHRSFLDKLKSILRGVGDRDIVRERTYTKLKIGNAEQGHLFTDQD